MPLSAFERESLEAVGDIPIFAKTMADVAMTDEMNESVVAQQDTMGYGGRC